ncbi:peptidase S8 and S53 subtilisin kexin sedolisin, partial [Pseudomonas floridensis]
MFSRSLLVAATLACSSFALAKDNLRIERLQRCDDLLDRQQQTFCLRAKGMDTGPVEIRLGDKTLPESAIQRDGDSLRVRLNYADWQSAPIWLQQAGNSSNPVWLSMAGSHVLAATPDEVAKNMDGLTTYVNLISLIIEERFDGREEAQRIAQKFGATVVGSIAPLNTWQLRLPAKNLVERDATVLRMGSEVSVDAVVIEESRGEAAESEAPPSDGKQEKPTREQWTANRFMDAVNYYQRRIPGKVSPITPVPIRIG